jgi:predicted phosphodiesterase
MSPDAASSWTFLHVNDSHMGTPRSYRFRPAINQRWAAIKRQLEVENAELLLHGGDLTRDGETHEFEYLQAREDLDTLPFPSFIIPGNMDVGNKTADTNGDKSKGPRAWDWHDPDLNLTGDRLDLFASYFGPIHWSFVHRNVRFTGFYAGVAGSGLPQEQRMWRMLERLSQLPSTEHHVAVMHYWPFIERLDEPAWDLTDADQYYDWYFSIDPPHRQRLWDLLCKAKVDILFCGHVHTGRSVQVVDGIQLYRTQPAGNTGQLSERWPDADTRFGYQRCVVSESGIEVSFVVGDDQCDEFDSFGPWGHPAVEERDYSVAREQPPLTPDALWEPLE